MFEKILVKTISHEIVQTFFVKSQYYPFQNVKEKKIAFLLQILSNARSHVNTNYP